MNIIYIKDAIVNNKVSRYFKQIMLIIIVPFILLGFSITIISLLVADKSDQNNNTNKSNRSNQGDYLFQFLFLCIPAMIVLSMSSCIIGLHTFIEKCKIERETERQIQIHLEIQLQSV